HVPFGQVRLGGKKTGTRKGDAIRLGQVLDDARARVAKVLAESNPELPAQEAEAVARDVGIGAVGVANLVAQPEKAVDFGWEDILSLQGDSAPYVQYSHARAASILRRAGVDAGSLGDVDAAPLARPEEWALALRLSDFADETARAAATDEP